MINTRREADDAASMGCVFIPVLIILLVLAFVRGYALVALYWMARGA